MIGSRSSWVLKGDRVGWGGEGIAFFFLVLISLFVLQFLVFCCQCTLLGVCVGKEHKPDMKLKLRLMTLILRPPVWSGGLAR